MCVCVYGRHVRVSWVLGCGKAEMRATQTNVQKPLTNFETIFEQIIFPKTEKKVKSEKMLKRRK